MILTGTAIAKARSEGSIVIEPFEPASLNPNSYNFRLGEHLVELSPGQAIGAGSLVQIPAAGYLLLPRRLYLASTLETIGSDRYAMTLLGRSSLGRLGLFLNISADLGHVGSASPWTLELSAVQPLRIYSGMRIGQVAFWISQQALSRYSGRYAAQNGPILCRDPELRGGKSPIGVKQV